MIGKVTRRIFLVLIFFTVVAAGPIGAGQKPEDPQSVTSKGEKSPVAASVDFRKAYSLPFGSLGTLGSRIDSARRSHDPVSLAHAANELAVAENVSGKKASLTSTAVLKEAAELAKLRKQVAELQAVRNLANQIAKEEALDAELQKEIAVSQQQAKAETDAVRSMQEPTDTPRKVLVNNYTTQYIDIWVNGYLKTTVSPGQSQWFAIEQKWNPVVLKAYGNEDTTTWGPRPLWGNFKTYTWNLTPPGA
jgi:hypothetical protein